MLLRTGPDGRGGGRRRSPRRRLRRSHFTRVEPRAALGAVAVRSAAARGVELASVAVPTLVVGTQVILTPWPAAEELVELIPAPS